MHTPLRVRIFLILNNLTTSFNKCQIQIRQITIFICVFVFLCIICNFCIYFTLFTG